MAINPKVDIVYNMVPKNRATEVKDGARRWNGVQLREEYWSAAEQEWLPIAEDRPGLTMWTTSTSVGVNTYILSGGTFPSSDSSMYLVYYGAGKLSYKDYTIDASAGTITLSQSPQVIQELAVYYVGKSVVGALPAGDLEVGEGLRVSATDTGLRFSAAPASASTLGAIKVGKGLVIDGEGVLSAAVTDIPVASATKVGGVKVGNTLSIDDDGILDVVTQDGDALQEWSTTTVVGTATYNVGLDLPSSDSTSYVVTYGGGILSPSNYSVDASANTITLSEAPTEATLLRVMFFKNLRVGYVVAEANLSDSVDSVSSTTAATSYAVKTAYDKATSAASAAAAAQTTANSAVTKADTAQSTANSAVTKADTAQASADAAQTAANAAIKTINGASPDSSGNVDVSAVPVGTVFWTGSNAVPAGFLLCNGAAVSRIGFPDLFNAIGTTYGSGDGSTTFNLPNLIDKFIQGSATAGVTIDAGLPNITGGFMIDPASYASAVRVKDYHGAFAATTNGNINNFQTSGSYVADYGINFDASRSNPIYGASTTVQPPAVTMLPCIKAFDGPVNQGTVDVAALAQQLVTLQELPGSVKSFATNSTPNGWLLCNGAAISRTTYSALFSAIGTTYGSGDGSTTFNLPNLIDRFIQGSATAGTVKEAGLPNITGTLSGKNTVDCYSGAFARDTSKALPAFTGDSNNYIATFNASRSNSIYGTSSTVQPPAVTMRYCIKY